MVSLTVAGDSQCLTAGLVDKLLWLWFRLWNIRASIGYTPSCDVGRATIFNSLVNYP